MNWGCYEGGRKKKKLELLVQIFGMAASTAGVLLVLVLG